MQPRKAARWLLSPSFPSDPASAPFPVTEPNANVAGYPAVAFVQDEMLTMFRSDGKHVYRLWYTAMHSEKGLQVYQHLLDTFRLADTAATTGMGSWLLATSTSHEHRLVG